VLVNALLVRPDAAQRQSCERQAAWDGRCVVVNAAKIAVRRAQRLSWRQKTGETGISKGTAERVAF
jgi:hypothetical protein